MAKTRYTKGGIARKMKYKSPLITMITIEMEACIATTSTFISSEASPSETPLVTDWEEEQGSTLKMDF